MIDTSWFADLSDEPDEAASATPWQPFVRTDAGVFALRAWFATKAECETFIGEYLTAPGARRPREGRVTTVRPDDPYEIRAQMLRILAGAHRKKAAEFDLAASAVLATRSVKAFGDAMLALEAREFAEHPDVAEALAQLEGFYGEEE